MIQKPIGKVPIPSLTTEQMREVDRLMVEKYGVQIVQMMENAGRSLARLIRNRLGGSVSGKEVTIAAGGGNNGGGGMVAARHLYNSGAKVTVLVKTEDQNPIPQLQWKILKQLPLEKKIGSKALEFLKNFSGDAIADCLIGYGLRGHPRGWNREMINAINISETQVISLDVPSGLDSTTGEVHIPCIEAAATLTLALPKKGLLKADAKKVVGALYLADIGVPNILYRDIGIAVPQIFNNHEIISLDADYEGGLIT
jgi:NAD(P)H-hydrate epimerase